MDVSSEYTTLGGLILVILGQILTFLRYELNERRKEKELQQRRLAKSQSQNKNGIEKEKKWEEKTSSV